MKTSEEQDALKSRESKKECQEREIGIAVDAQKLSQGLKMTFEGVAMIFDSLGANSEATGTPYTSKRLSASLPLLKEHSHTEKSEAHIQKKLEQEASKAPSTATTSTAIAIASTELEASSEVAGRAETAETAATTEINGSTNEVYAVNEVNASENSDEASHPYISAELSAEEKPEQVGRVEQTKQSDTVKAAKSAITSDDITKVIVEKLKQDRDNNKKIEALVHKYGVSVISQLTEEKYEAFMTELVSL